MATIVVPFRRGAGKQRLAPLPEGTRAALAQAMLDDVVAVCEEVGTTVIADHAGGQGRAVEDALAELADGPVAIVNADVPCVTPRDVLALLGAVPPGGLALVAAADGTTNALALSGPRLFAPRYGPGSADRFTALAESRVVEIPNLRDDVDTVDDLERLEERLGPRTRAVLASLPLQAAR